MAIFKLNKQDRDYYDLQELLKPKEELEKSSGIGTKPVNQEQDDEGLFSGFFGGLFDRSRQQAKELSVLAEEEAIRSALEIRLMRQASGITSSKPSTEQLSDMARDAMFSSSDMRGIDLTMKDNAREAQDVFQPMITPVSRGEQPEMADSPAPVDAPSIDTRSNEMLDKAKGIMSKDIEDVLETVLDSDASDSTDSADGGAAPSGGKGIMSPMQGPDFYPSNEGSVKTYARDMFPDNPQAAAALAASIQFEGMKRPEEDVSSYSWANITNPNSPAGFLKPSITNSTKPWARKRTAVLYKLYGGEPVTDSEGNKVPLTSALTDEEEKSVQTTLKKAGFYKGEIDGAFGPNSKKALKAWQKEKDITASGKLDTPTLTALGLDKIMKDHEGNTLYEYSKPTKVTVPLGERVVDVTYNPYYRAEGYEDAKIDIPKEGSAGNTSGAGKYRGRGPIQITGKAVYARLAPAVEAATGVNILENPEAIVDNLQVSRAATKAYLDDVGFENLSVDAMLKAINPNKPNIVNVRKPAYTKYLKAMK